MFRYICFLLFPLLVGMSGEPEFPLRKIIGKGLLKGEKGKFVSDSANAPHGEQYYFYSNVSPEDSVNVIAERKSRYAHLKYCDYAFIIHNKYSESHQTFSEDSIRQRIHDMDPVLRTKYANVEGERSIDRDLLREVEGIWVYVHKYQGEFYLQQCWHRLMAFELTDTAYIQLFDKTTVFGMRSLRGDKSSFSVGLNKHDLEFHLVDTAREIYRVNTRAYVIPVRRIHDFKLIGYCRGGGRNETVYPFVKFDMEFKPESLRKIIGKGLTKAEQGWPYVSDPANTPTGEQYYFRTNVSPGDSVVVIAEEEHKVTRGVERMMFSWHCYAYIIHNKYSDSHQNFSENTIRKEIDAIGPEYRTMWAKVKGEREIDTNLLKKVGGIWVYLRKYKGEYYLHQDWSVWVHAFELTDTAFVDVDMEPIIIGMKSLQGDEKSFRIEKNNGKMEFRLVDPEREVYQVGKRIYAIPVRRIHDFKLIGYCGNECSLIDSFVEWDSSD